MADSVKIKIDGDDSGFQKALGGIGNIAKSGMKVALGAVTAVSGALAAGGAEAVKFGMEFQQSAAKASTLFGDVAVDTDNLNKKILQLSSSTGVAATELNEGLYSALSAGIPATEDMGNATGFLESSAKLAKAGFTDVDTAISATAKTLNAYGMDVSQADKIQGILIQTQNKGITTVNELGASLAQVTPTAAAFGVNFENVGASLATMTAQGTPTAQATTQLNSLIAELGKSGTLASKNLTNAANGTKYAGQSFSEMMNSGASLDDVLQLLNNSAEKNGLSMVDMFSSIEAGKAALSITSEGGTVFNDNLLAMADTTGVVDDAYGKMSNTLQSQSQRMVETVKNLGISIFEDNDTILASAAGFSNDLLDQLTSAFNADGLDGLVSALGNVAAQLITKIAEYGPQMVETAFSLIESFGNGLSENIDLITNKSIEIAMSFINGLLDGIPDVLNMGIEIINSLIDGISQQLPQLIPAAINTVIELVNSLYTQLPQILESGCQMLQSLAEGIVNAIPQLIAQLPTIIQNMVNYFVTALPTIIQTGLKIIVTLAAGCIKAIPQLLKALPQIVSSLTNGFNALMSQIGEIGKNIVNGIWNGIVKAKDWLLDKIKSFASSITQGIKDFFGIQSPSKVMRDQVGKMLTAGIAVGIELGTSEVQKVMNSMNKNLLESEQFYLDESLRIEREKEQKEYDEKLNAAKTAEDRQKIIDERNLKQAEKAQKEYLDSLKSSADNERKIYDALQKDIEKIQDKITDTYTDKIEEIQKKQDKFADKLMDTVELTQKASKTMYSADGYLFGKDGIEVKTTQLSSLKAANDGIEEYASNLKKIKDLVPSSLYSEILDMSVEKGSQFFNAFWGSTEDERNEYIAEWERLQQNMAKIPKKITEDETEELRQELIDKFGDCPEKFFNIGENSVKQFGEGFLSQLNNIMNDIKDKINTAFSGITPALAVAGSNGNTSYLDNRTTTIIANSVTAHDIIDAQRQNEIYQNHVGGWSY